MNIMKNYTLNCKPDYTSISVYERYCFKNYNIVPNVPFFKAATAPRESGIPTIAGARALTHTHSVGLFWTSD